MLRSTADALTDMMVGVVREFSEKVLRPGAATAEPTADEPAKSYIMEQDQAIAEKSGQPPLPIKTLRRSGK